MWSTGKDDELKRNVCFYHDDRPTNAYEAAIKCSLDGGRLASTHQQEMLKVFSSHSGSQPVWMGKTLFQLWISIGRLTDFFRLSRKSAKRFKFSFCL